MMAGKRREYKRIPYQEFKRIYSRVARACVDLIVRSDQGIILTKRKIVPFAGMWHIPGGSVLFWEPIEHALARIAREELGLDVKVISHLGIIEYLNEEDGSHSISNAFLADKTSGEMKSCHQSEEIKIFDQIPGNCIPVQRQFLEKHLQEIFK